MVLILKILEEFQLITMALLCFKKPHEILWFFGFSQPTHPERVYIITNVKFIINLSPHTRHFNHLIKFFFLNFPSFLGIIYATIIFIYIIINRLLFLLCVKLHLKKNKKVFYFSFFVLMIVKGLNHTEG